jgi:hypothetical protein
VDGGTIVHPQRTIIILPEGKLFLAINLDDGNEKKAARKKANKLEKDNKFGQLLKWQKGGIWVGMCAGKMVKKKNGRRKEGVDEDKNQQHKREMGKEPFRGLFERGCLDWDHGNRPKMAKKSDWWGKCFKMVMIGTEYARIFLKNFYRCKLDWNFYEFVQFVYLHWPQTKPLGQLTMNLNGRERRMFPLMFLVGNLFSLNLKFAKIKAEYEYVVL